MKLKITGAFLALVGSSFGATITLSSVGVNYDGTDDYGVLLSNGTAVAPLGGLARVGFFTSLTDTQVSDLAAIQDYATLFGGGSFTTIFSDDFTGIATAYGPTDGFVSGSITGYNAAGLNNTLYVYITSGTELGLFKTTSTIVPDPVLPTPESSYTLSFGVGSGVIGGAGPTYSVDYSNIGGGTVDVNSFQLVDSVPEPSAALLGAIGVLGLLRRRRI